MEQWSIGNSLTELCEEVKMICTYLSELHRTIQYSSIPVLHHQNMCSANYLWPGPEDQVLDFKHKGNES
jgi:hypothetical protein